MGDARGLTRSLVTAAVATAVTAVLAWIGLVFERRMVAAMPLWLADVPVLAILIRIPSIDRRWALGGAFAGLAIGYATGIAGPTAAVLAGIETFEIVLGLALFERFRHQHLSLHAPRTIAAFFLGPGLIAPAVATAIYGIVCMVDGAVADRMPLLRWFMANALGMILIGPMLLTAGCSDCRALARSPRIREISLAIAGIVAVSYLVFHQARYPALFLIPPALTFAIFRLRFIGAATGIVIVTSIASWATLQGRGAIATVIGQTGDSVLLLQVFLAVIALTNYPIAAILAEREVMSGRLVDQERRFRLMAEAAPIAMFRTDAAGHVVYGNEHWQALAGVVAGDPWYAIVVPDHRGDVSARWAAAVLSRQLFEIEVEATRRDGGSGWIAIVMGCDVDAGGVAGWTGVAIDVEERRRTAAHMAETAARLGESNRLLNMAERIAGIGHWRLDARTHDLFWSDEVFRIHGRPIGDLPPLADAIDVYHPDDRPLVRQFVDAALQRGAPWTFWARLIRPDGTIRHVESSGQAECAPDGGIAGIVGVFRDITAEVEAAAALTTARDEAQASAAARSAFLATMSHEIRTPMTGVLGMIELLRSDLSPADRERFFDNLEQSAALLMTVLDDVLDFSKIESGNLTLESVEFDLVALARNSIDLFHHAASGKGLILSLSAPVADDLYVRGDPVRLRQVMANLIGNAIKFTDTGKVELRIEPLSRGDPRRISIAVADTGIGIEPEALGRLFAPFVQADLSTTRRYGGSGLGLAICKRLVDAMRGEIDVESIVGVGTTFRMTLDLPAGRPRRPDPPQPEAGSPRPLSILLAEDNAINRTLVEALLRSDGHAIVSVVNGREAVEASLRQPFDAIVMDMQMPEMDGLTATRLIRQNGGPNVAAPIIALTADATAERRRFYDNAGLTGFLTKPINRATLRRCLAGIADGERSFTGNDAPVLDDAVLTDLDQVVGAAQTCTLLDMLRRELRERVPDVLRLVEEGDRTTLSSALHALKGAALNVGAIHLGWVIRRFERASAAGLPLDGFGEALVTSAQLTIAAIDRRAEA